MYEEAEWKKYGTVELMVSHIGHSNWIWNDHIQVYKRYSLLKPTSLLATFVLEFNSCDYIFSLGILFAPHCFDWLCIFKFYRMLIIRHTVICTSYTFGSVWNTEHKNGQDWYDPCTCGAWDLAKTNNQQVN